MLLGLTVIFVNLKQAFNSQDQLALLQDNERLALSVLTTSIQSAGYFPDPRNITLADSLPVASTSHGNFAAGQGIVGTTGATAAGDTVTTRYLTAVDDGLMNCLGVTRTTPGTTPYTNLFAVNANSELTCSTDGGTTSTPLVSNVTRLAVLYGTDTDSDDNVDRYLAASAVAAGSLWDRVRTARVSVSFRNPFAGQAGQPDAVTWTQTISVMNRL